MFMFIYIITYNKTTEKKMLHTTLNLLKEKEACLSGYKKVLEFVGKDFDKDKEIPLTDILKSNDLEDTLWVIDNRATIEDSYKFQIKFGTWCARQVLQYWKSEYQEDETIENCLDIRDRFVNDDSTFDEMSSARESAWESAWRGWPGSWRPAAPPGRPPGCGR